MATQTQARVVTFGLGKDNEVRASDITLDWPKGTKFKLHAWGEVVSEHSADWTGEWFIHSGCDCSCSGEGLPLDQTLSALETFPPSPGDWSQFGFRTGLFHPMR